MPLEQYERILLTGGTGFIGRVVLRTLLARGSRPLVVSRSNSRPSGVDPHDTVTLDLADQPGIARLIKDYRPELVIHLAGATVTGDPARRYRGDLFYDSTAALLGESARWGVKRAIILGSASEYGDNPIPFTEEMELRPVSDYARSKARVTRFALELSETSGLGVTILRAFTVYGPHQPPNMFISQLVRHAILNRDFEMSDGLQIRDFINVADVAEAIVLAAKSGQSSGRVINVGSGVGVALRDAAELIWTKCSADIGKLHIGAIGKSGDDSLDTLADIRLSAHLINWRPTTTFESGVDLIVESMTSSLFAAKDLHFEV